MDLFGCWKTQIGTLKFKTKSNLQTQISETVRQSEIRKSYRNLKLCSNKSWNCRLAYLEISWCTQVFIFFEENHFLKLLFTFQTSLRDKNQTYLWVFGEYDQFLVKIAIKIPSRQNSSELMEEFSKCF